MQKPSVFFSHSSKDKNVLSKLKELFIDKTSNSVDVFLSSDGQSIPLGRNWVYKIQDALKNSQLMFVFLTPNSINSDWIYFESGFSYSKNIKVIPIGLLGVDLSKIPPPISLLQGFNIDSEDSLNNLIAIVNDEFGFKHKQSFNTAEYYEIVGNEPSSLSKLLNESNDDISKISLWLNVSGFLKERANFLDEVEKYLKKEKISYSRYSNRIDLFGLTIKEDTNSFSQDFQFLVDPILLDKSMQDLELIINEFRTDKFLGLRLNIKFQDYVNVIDENQTITALLYGTDVELGQSEGKFIYKDLKFDFHIHKKGFLGAKKSFLKSISIDITSTEIQFHQIDNLIELLFNKEILFHERH